MPPFGAGSGVSPKLNVSAVAAVHHVHVLAGCGIDAEDPRPLGLGAYELERFLSSQIRRRYVLGQRRRASRAAFTKLHEGSEATYPYAQRLAAVRVGSEIEHGIIRTSLRRA